MGRTLPILLRALVAIALLVTPAVATAAASGPATALPGAIPGLALPAAVAAGEFSFSELPNFHRVDDCLFRGGQPQVGGYARLKAVGVRTVVNLRYERALGQAEEAAAKAAGLQYFNVPMYGLVRPTQAQIARALALIGDPRNQPVFVHCQRGADRTGAVVACYRIAHTRWTAERAIQEAMGYGMLWLEIAKRSFIRDFYAKIGA